MSYEKRARRLSLAAFLIAGTFVAALPLQAHAAELARGGESVQAIIGEDGKLVAKTGEDAFLDGLDAADAKIDYAALNVSREHELIAADGRFALGARLDNGDPCVVFTEALEANASAKVEGECFTLRFPDAATMLDGSKAAVRVSFSNMTIKSGEKALGHNGSSVAITRGNNVFALGAGADGGKAPAAISCDIKISVEGAPADATVLFSACDIDASGEGRPGAEAFSESLQIKSGLASAVHVPEAGYLEVTKEGLRYTAQPNPAAGGRFIDYNSYASGFAALMRASGFTVHWWGNCGSNGTAFGVGLAPYAKLKAQEGPAAQESEPPLSQNAQAPQSQSAAPADASPVPDPAPEPEPLPKGFSVSFADGAHGTSDGAVQEGLAKGSHPKDENNVSADKGWAFAGRYSYSISLDGSVIEEGEVARPSMVTVSGDVVFTPVYQPVVSISCEAGGTVDPAGDVAVEYGVNASFTLKADEGYALKAVTVNGAAVTAKSQDDGTWKLTLRKVKAPAELKVSWKEAPGGQDAGIDDAGGYDAGGEDWVDDSVELLTYTVTFKDPDGRTLKEEVVLAGTAATAPAIPKRVEEVFSHWDRRFDYVVRDTVVKAVYVPGEAYTPDYSLHGGGSEKTSPSGLPKTGDAAGAAGAAAMAAASLVAVSRVLKRRSR